MQTKQEIVKDWLPRYTGIPIRKIGKYIILTNFMEYVHKFAKKFNVEVKGMDKPMPNATSGAITIINFGMGSANAATVMDLLSARNPQACLFLGKCGGLKRKNMIGDLILPIAAIRGDGTSNCGRRTPSACIGCARPAAPRACCHARCSPRAS